MAWTHERRASDLIMMRLVAGLITSRTLWTTVCIVKVTVFTAIWEQDMDISISPPPRPQGKPVNHLETPLRQAHKTPSTSSCAKQPGHVRLCSKPWGPRRIDPVTFRRRGQYLSLLPTSTDVLNVPVYNTEKAAEARQRHKGHKTPHAQKLRKPSNPP